MNHSIDFDQYYNERLFDMRFEWAFKRWIDLMLDGSILVCSQEMYKEIQIFFIKGMQFLGT